jgi:hypothetical protein
MSDEDIIKSGMATVPPAVATEVTIIDISADGKTRVMRKGANGFTCLPDNPESPGPDPHVRRPERHGMGGKPGSRRKSCPGTRSASCIYLPVARYRDPEGLPHI